MPSVGQACRSAVRQTISASAFTVQRIWNLLKSGLASAEWGGVVSGYTLKMDGLNIVNLNSEQYHTLNWIGTLLQHRRPNNLDDDSDYAREYLIQNYAVDLSRADVVGYRADDSYFQYATDFLQNRISLDKLSEAMHLGKLVEQVVIKSERAFERLTFKRAYQNPFIHGA